MGISSRSNEEVTKEPKSVTNSNLQYNKSISESY